MHMEVGHASQNVYPQATAIGLGTVTVGAFEDSALAAAVALPPDLRPLGIMPVGYVP